VRPSLAAGRVKNKGLHFPSGPWLRGGNAQAVTERPSLAAPIVENSDLDSLSAGQGKLGLQPASAHLSLSLSREDESLESLRGHMSSTPGTQLPQGQSYRAIATWARAAVPVPADST
jgi:hypothetical protein